MRLGQIPLAQPRRRYLGQADVLTVQVNRDGTPAPGVAVEVLLADGSATDGVTDTAGAYQVPYTAAAFGMATALITPPADVVEMGEENAQGVDLQGGPAGVVFEMLSAEAPPFPAVEENGKTVVALATTALLVLIGTSI